MRLVLIFVALALGCRAASTDPGLTVYQQHCAACHDHASGTRVPPRAALQERSVRTIRRALETGVMREQGAKLNPTERTAVALWLGHPASPLSGAALSNACANRDLFAGAEHAASWSGWGAGPQNWRHQAAAPAGFDAEQVSKLKLKWAFGMPEATEVRSQPAVYGETVFVGGDNAMAYAIDTRTGCTHWATEVLASVRSGMVVGVGAGKPLVFFGDGSGQVYALDAGTGQPVWQMRADDHPTTVITGTPTYYEGHLYVPVTSGDEGAAMQPGYVCCTARGSVLAVDAGTGKVLWKTYTISEPAKPGPLSKHGAKTAGPSGAGVWSSPTLDLDKGLLYVATGDNYSNPATNTSDAVLALSMKTGEIAWSKQLTPNDVFTVGCNLPDLTNCPDAPGPDFDFGSSPILVKLPSGQRVLALGQKSGLVYGIDPDHEGRVLWQSRAGHGSVLGGIQWGPASDGTNVYAALSDVKFTVTNGKVPAIDRHEGGGLFAFRLDNGERSWMAPPATCPSDRPCSPAQSAAISVISGLVFSGAMDGHIRAYETKTGNVMWDYDTAHSYQTVNHVPGNGGALDAGGPIAAGGLLFVNSGYGKFGGLPGNVLLAFSVDGR